jgi:plastocyanin
MKAAGLLSLLLPGVALANGSISGTVRAERPPRDLPPVAIAKDAAVCGKEAARDVLVVASDGAVANVVVSLAGVKPAQPPPPTVGAAVDQVGCRYAPHVQAVTVGTALEVLNNDAVLHNVHGTIEGASSPITVFNVAMPFKGGKAPQVLKRPGAIKLRCDAGHSWMSAYVHVFDHPYFAVTDRKGRFTIPEVPPGRYTVAYWHEPLGEKQPAVTRTATIEVTDGKAASGDLTLVF